MASVPNWTNDGYTFERRFSLGALFGRLLGRSQPAPPAPKSLIYVLCEEYRHLDLWTAYHAFRLDPRERNWRKLRRRNVPWQSDQTVEGLLHRLYPWNGKGTPDPNTVGLALVSASSSSAASSNKKKR